MNNTIQQLIETMTPEELKQRLAAYMTADLQFSPRKTVQEVVKQLHGFGRRDGLVIDIARKDYHIRVFPVDDLQAFRQNIPLVLQHTELVDPLSEMQVREMDQLQVAALPFLTYHVRAEV